MTPVDVHSRDLQTVKRILAEHVPECDVYAFGSRVTGKARKASDLDLAVMTDKPLDTLRRADLREAFSESDLSFKVDIVDWSAIKEDFRKHVLENRRRIQTAMKRKRVR